MLQKEWLLYRLIIVSDICTILLRSRVFEDAKDAICWLRSHASDYQLDPDKIAVAGGSAGGHLAAALGTIGSDETVPAGYRPNLSVLYYPVIDMVREVMVFRK